jgi:hypothetical protein
MALTPILRIVMAAALALPLAACGTGRDDPLVRAVQGLTGTVFGGEEEATPVFTAATVPPELVAQLPGPLMLVEVLSSQRSTGMTRVGRNGPDETWRGPNGIGLTVDGAGVLRATRGFGFDLMASDVRPTAAALRARRAGQVERAMIHLDGEAGQIRRVYTCEMQLDGRETVTIAGRETALTRMTERCIGGDGYRFENVFWLDQGGQAVQSMQWVSAEIGGFRITRLRD